MCQNAIPPVPGFVAGGGWVFGGFVGCGCGGVVAGGGESGEAFCAGAGGGVSGAAVWGGEVPSGATLWPGGVVVVAPEVALPDAVPV